LKASQNSNWLTAQDHMGIKPATVALWTTPSTSSRTTAYFTKTNILTGLSSKLARTKLETSRFLDSLTSRIATISSTQSLEDPFRLPSMPPTGHPTRAEFSTTARPPSTTEFYLSELLTNTGGSRTHGEPPGEKKDLSDSPEATLVASATSLHIPLNDSVII